MGVKSGEYNRNFFGFKIRAAERSVRFAFGLMVTNTETSQTGK
jgi:hypothetical protein